MCRTALGFRCWLSIKNSESLKGTICRGCGGVQSGEEGVCDELVLEIAGVGGCSIRLSQRLKIGGDIYQAFVKLSKGTWQYAALR